MTYQQLEQLFKSVTYKPDWRIDCDLSLQRIRIAFKAQDSRDPNSPKPAIIRSDFAIPTEFLLHEIPMNYLQAWLFDELLRLENHEAQEWFRINVDMIYDPHRERT